MRRELPAILFAIHSFGTVCARAAGGKLTAALRSQQQGIAVPIKRETLGPFLNRWLDQSAKRKVAESTPATYRWLVDKHIEPELA